MKQKEGFTLFELLIALFIGTLLIMAGAYAIRVGLFSLERDEAWFNESAKEKAVYDFFWQQSSALRIQRIPKKQSGVNENEENKNLKTKKTIYFTGKRDFLTFVSPLSFARHYGQGLVIANYRIKINDSGLWDLLYSEHKVNPAMLITLSEELESLVRADKDPTVFLKDCDKISFAYLDNAGDENDDESEVESEEKKPGSTKGDDLGRFQHADVIEGTDLQWKEEVKKHVPLAIKLLVSKHGKEQELVSPIMVMH